MGNFYFNSLFIVFSILNNYFQLSNPTDAELINPNENYIIPQNRIRANHIRTIKIKSFNAKQQSYDLEQEIQYDERGNKIQHINYAISPSKVVSSYFYENNLCTLYVNMKGNDSVQKLTYRYEGNNLMAYMEVFNYDVKPFYYTKDYLYNHDGKLTSVVSKNKLNKMMDSLAIDYYPDFKKKEIRKYNHSRKMTEKAEFNCDAVDFSEGNKYVLVHYCTHVQKEPRGTFTKNTVETHSDGNSTQYESVFNKDSVQISYELFNEKGVAILKEEYLSDDQRNLTEYHSYRKQKPESKKKYVYNNMNEIKLAEEYDGNGSLMSRYIFEYEKY